MAGWNKKSHTIAQQACFHQSKLKRDFYPYQTSYVRTEVKLKKKK